MQLVISALLGTEVALFIAMSHIFPGRAPFLHPLQSLNGQRLNVTGSLVFPDCPSLSILARHAVVPSHSGFFKSSFAFLLVSIWFVFWGGPVGDVVNLSTPHPRMESVFCFLGNDIFS